jgi:ABC-type nitrate/sulfonate/bicarbonate transport system permease component
MAARATHDRVAGRGFLGWLIEWRGTYRLLTLAVFLALWQVYALNANSVLIATVDETVVGLSTLLFDPRLYEAFLISNQAMILGFVIAMALGIPLGLALGRFRAAESFVNVYLSFLLASPLAVIIPLLIMSVGIGLASRVILTGLFAFINIVITVRAGVRQVDPRLIEMAKAFGASELQTWRKVLLPGSLPAIMAGARLGLGSAVEGMVIIELLMVAAGIGNLVLIFRGSLEAGLLYALILCVIAEGLLLISLARWLEQRLTPWVWQRGLR